MSLGPVPLVSKRDFKRVQLHAEGSGKDIAALGFYKGRNIRRLKPNKLMYFHEIHCHSAKNRFTRFLTSLVSLGRVRYRNISLDLGNGKTTKVAINVQQLSRQYQLTAEQKGRLLHAKNDIDRTEVFVEVLEKKIQDTANLKEKMKPQPGEKPELWVNRFLASYGILRGGNYCQKVCSLELEPHQVDYYSHLQRVVAQKLPQESHRPTIDLELVGSKVPKDGSAFTLGVLGGVGPVSDSIITTQTIENLKQRGADLDHVSLNVFSCPPPRKKRELVFDGKDYLANMKKFSRRGNIQTYAIASNTAHVNIDFLRTIGFQQRMKNMVRKVCGDIQAGQPRPEGVLVLGTTQGYEHNLYPGELKRYGVNGLTIASKKQQKTLQKIIDRTKRAGNDSEKDALYKFAEKQIQALRKKHKVSHVLLGCTELPLALGHAYIKKLEENLNVKVVDTEVEFANSFADMVTRGNATLRLK